VRGKTAEAGAAATAHPGRLGRRAEDLAAAFLEGRGFRVLARNWRRPEGELDIVADHGGVCVFVEVRSRTGEEQGHPLETVDRRKRAQVIRAARLYLDEEAPRAASFRFDVVGVVFPDGGEEPSCVHVEDAFRVGE
jgi:putative endonuclease